MTNKLFTLKDVKNSELINVPFVSMTELTGKTVIIHKSETVNRKAVDGSDSTSVQMTCTTPDNPELFTTLTGSYVFKNLHDLISEQNAYPIQITIKTENRKYIIE